MVPSNGPGPERSPEEPREDGESGLSFVSILALLVRRRRLLVGLPLAVFVAAVGLSYLMPEQYTAQSRFLPETESEMPGEFAGLAAQMGLGAAAMAGAGESLDFYGQLVRSHEILTAAILTEYEVPIEEGSDTVRGNLIELYDFEGDTPVERLKVAKQLMEERYIMVSPYRNANLLVLRTQAQWPALAEAVNRRLLTLVNEFNLGRRQTRAAEERDFLETRLEQVQGELRQAEDELQRFVETNRRYSAAPETSLQYARLQRRVTFVEQIYSSVIQSLEQAQVEAIRNMPVITVVDRPEGTALKTAPKPLINGLLGLVLGAGLAIALVLVGEFLSGARRSHPREYADLQSAVREMMRGFGLRRKKRGRPSGGTAQEVVERPSERDPERPVAVSMGGRER